MFQFYGNTTTPYAICKSANRFKVLVTYAQKFKNRNIGRIFKNIPHESKDALNI